MFKLTGLGVAGAMEEKHLRTFQRRVRDWPLENGPGKVLAMDWTDMGGLGKGCRCREMRN